MHEMQRRREFFDMHEDENEDTDDGKPNPYQVLGVAQSATLEEIEQAFRRLSTLFHPDKHPLHKQESELIFTKISKAYEVLKNPTNRQLYDMDKDRALVLGQEIAVRGVSKVEEIRAEYERLKRRRIQQYLQMRTNAKGVVVAAVDASALFDNSVAVEAHQRARQRQQEQQQQKRQARGKRTDAAEDERDTEETAERQQTKRRQQLTVDMHDDELEARGMSFSLEDIAIAALSIQQSIECPVSDKNVVTFSGQLGVRNGNGSGSVLASLRHQISNLAWGEVEVGAGSGGQLTVRGLRHINKHLYFVGMATVQQLNAGRYALGYSGTVAQTLGAHTTGFLTLGGGIHSAINSTISRTTENSQFTGIMQFGLNQTILGLTYVHNLTDSSRFRIAGKAGSNGVLIEYGADRKVAKNTRIGMSLTIGIPMGIVFKLKITRVAQQYVLPITLSHDVLPAPAVFGTVVPLALYSLFHMFVMLPHRAREAQRKLDQLREENAEKIALAKREAKVAIDLMREAVERKIAIEAERAGLIIIKALYGRVKEPQSRRETSEFVIDVTLPLQSHVKDSELHLHEGSKANMLGFYDPCIGETKHLYISYKFKELMHEVLIPDEEPLSIPKRSHLLPMRR
ncbi:DnaJ domain-containing protein [Capsaspora owczarzaki ATCC 30864]|uniref:DnaJ domain-containing protein n=2 Tax=Capsaspora owczarzaki (strain ATCC 30864) TaxID=595528 RepID=A0A0D2VWD2_CAPO3|nr:DnaJ domain-containing protein [Capsaspora owczarzaki ATCC 30864]